MARRRTWRVWVWNLCGDLVTAHTQPEWKEEIWVDPMEEENLYSFSDKPFQMRLLGLHRLPPRSVAWLVEVTAPGKSRIVKREKGE